MTNGFRIPEWAHLIPSVTDDTQTLLSKTQQLQTLAQGLREVVERQRLEVLRAHDRENCTMVRSSDLEDSESDAKEVDSSFERFSTSGVEGGVDDDLLGGVGREVGLENGGDRSPSSSLVQGGEEEEACGIGQVNGIQEIEGRGVTEDVWEGSMDEIEDSGDMYEDLGLVVDGPASGVGQTHPVHENMDDSGDEKDWSGSDEFEEDEEEDEGLMMELHKPIESVKLDCSGRYIFVILRSEWTSDGQKGLRIFCWDLGSTFSSPPLSLGAIDTVLDDNVVDTSISRTWDIADTREGPMAILSAAHNISSPGGTTHSKSIKCLSIHPFSLHVAAQLGEQDGLHCIAATDKTIIAAGWQGRGCVWSMSSVSGTYAKKGELPQAYNRSGPFSTINELKLPQGKEPWVIGVSCLGSIVVWNYERLEVVTTVHHAAFQVSDLHFLPADTALSCNGNETSPMREQPLAFIGMFKERSNPNSQKRIAAMMLRKDILTVGYPFPIEGVQQLCGYGGEGLLATNEGSLTAFDIAKGECTWQQKELSDKQVNVIWMGCENVMVASGTQCGCLEVRKLAQYIK